MVFNPTPIFLANWDVSHASLFAGIRVDAQHSLVFARMRSVVAARKRCIPNISNNLLAAGAPTERV
jgi:hypothetical protein